MISSDEGTLLELSHSFTHLEISGQSASLFLNQHLLLEIREYIIHKFRFFFR
jgi:hypothetical protein